MARSTETFLVISALLTSPVASAEINFDILQNCQQIEELSNNITQEKFSTECREPETDIEHEVFEKSGGSHSAVCFLQSLPAPGLEGFSCMMNSVDDTNSITCLRSASAEEISAYKINYQNGPKKKTYDYLEKAAECSFSNGGATFSAPTLMPPLAILISKYEFGFISPIGKGRKTNSYVTHGYALTPSNHSSDAIEYVSILINGEYPIDEGKEVLTIGGWEIETDLGGLDERLNDWLEQQEIPARSKSVIFNISNTGAAKRTMDQKTSDLTNVSRKITRELVSEKFSPVPAHKISKEAKDALAKLFDSYIPFGYQGIPLGKLDKNFIMLMNEKRPRCTRNKAGAIGAYVFQQHPRPNIKSEYGSIMVALIGMGECADFSRPSNENYINGLLDIATETVKANYEQN
ncbi:hypothetical protein [Pseudomonas putida]|uniref:hypothetical protein n=1 Tax=Pseudomonas putida TaxID=303 RepID=UPI0016290918|nr:hypothetical protein [Pseudomonas putida]QNG09716.1 hypothetical protein GPM17_15200 [Pseudomonas putida]HDS1061941.1 hypothetical protein [Pseudomonas putida]